MDFKVGVMIESLRLGFEKGLEKSAEIGADGFQMYFQDSEPVLAERIQYIKKMVEGAGLQIAAVCGDIGDYTKPEQNAKKLLTMENILNFAHGLGVSVVTGHVGVIPHDENHPTYRAIHDAMMRIGKLAKERDIVYAIETGPEDTDLLCRFLDGLDGGVGVNFDPANLIMGGFSKDGADSVAAVGKYIVHTHAKDALPSIEGRPCIEVPLGKGHVNFPKWLKELKRFGYSGFLTIERETGEDPVADCAEAVKYLKGIMSDSED